jgi:hypothetical protein
MSTNVIDDPKDIVSRAPRTLIPLSWPGFLCNLCILCTFLLPIAIFSVRISSMTTVFFGCQGISLRRTPITLFSQFVQDNKLKQKIISKCNSLLLSSSPLSALPLPSPEARKYITLL